MILTIDISPDVEKALGEKAQRTGQSAAEVAAVLLKQALSSEQESDLTTQQADIEARLAAFERIGRYDTRARAGLPPLSDEAVSRESIYEGCGQ